MPAPRTAPAIPTAPTATPQPISRLGDAAPDGAAEDAAAPEPEADAPDPDPEAEPDWEAAEVMEPDAEVVDAEGATTVAVSTAVVAGTCDVSLVGQARSA